PQFEGERGTLATGWIKALAHELTNRLDATKVLKARERDNNISDDQSQAGFFSKAKVLDLFPYSDDRAFMGGLKPISHEIIQPVLTICHSSAQSSQGMYHMSL
ncbi:hypothetical protein AX17_006589, partial [Amanita inopinata Kibby_2008]